LQKNQIGLIQTAIRGRDPAPDKVHLSQFTIKFNPDGKPSTVTCPEGKPFPFKRAAARNPLSLISIRKPVRRVPCKKNVRDARHHLRFSQSQARSAERRRQSRTHASL